MKEYTLKINSDQAKRFTELPPMPFVIEVVYGGNGDKYLIVKNTNYKLISLSGHTLGSIVDRDYTESEILNAINDKKWTLKKSEINIV